MISISKPNKDSDDILSLEKLKLSSWLILAAALIVSLFGIGYFLFPLLAELHYREGYNLAAAGRYKFAIEELEIAVNYAPLESHYQVELGKDYENFAEQQVLHSEKVTYLLKAEKLYKNMVKLDWQNPWYQNRLATVYFALSKEVPEKKEDLLKFSEQYSQKASELDKNNPLFQLSHAYFLHQQGQLDKAIPFYKHVMEIDDSMLEAPFNLADIYHKKNQMDKAIELRTMIYKKQPDFQNIRLILGNLYYQKGDIAAAETMFKEELEKNGDKLETLKSLAAIYHHLKKWKEAIGFYQKVLERDPGNKMMLQFYIQTLISSGQRGKAIQVLSHYIAQNPQDEQAKQILAALR